MLSRIFWEKENGVGLAMMLAGFVTLLTTVGMKWSGGQWMSGNPLLLLSVCWSLNNQWLLNDQQT